MPPLPNNILGLSSINEIFSEFETENGFCNSGMANRTLGIKKAFKHQNFNFLINQLEQKHNEFIRHVKALYPTRTGFKKKKKSQDKSPFIVFLKGLNEIIIQWYDKISERNDSEKQEIISTLDSLRWKGFYELPVPPNV